MNLNGRIWGTIFPELRNRRSASTSRPIVGFRMNRLERPIDTLTPRERRVLQLRFGLADGHERTLEEVGKWFGVDRERIRQIEATALRKLRHQSPSMKLNDDVVFGADNTAAYLTSLNGAYRWQPGTNVSMCLRKGHQAPARGCSCGFYASHNLNLLTEYSFERGLVLIGVAATGIVQVHSRGWRAQFARIIAVSNENVVSIMQGDGPWIERMAHAVATTYHVPVVTRKDLVKMMRSVGDSMEDADEYRP